MGQTHLCLPDFTLAPRLWWTGLLLQCATCGAWRWEIPGLSWETKAVPCINLKFFSWKLFTSNYLRNAAHLLGLFLKMSTQSQLKIMVNCYLDFLYILCYLYLSERPDSMVWLVSRTQVVVEVLNVHSFMRSGNNDVYSSR